MVAIPLALLLMVGVFVSLTRGKGTPWFGLLCVTFGIVIANTAIGRALVDILQSLVTAASSAVTNVTRG